MTEAERALVDYRLQRAQETLQDAKLLSTHGRAHAVVNRLYYACFYAVSALLQSRGLTASKHSGVRSLFGQHFVKTGLVSRDMGRLYNDLFELRQESDYEDFVRVDPDILPGYLAQTEHFVHTVAQMVKRRSEE